MNCGSAYFFKLEVFYIWFNFDDRFVYFYECNLWIIHSNNVSVFAKRKARFMSEFILGLNFNMCLYEDVMFRGRKII